MRTRILPRDEWSRLERTEITPFSTMPPEDIAVVVVEDEDKVLACMTVVRLTHLEGLWIDPGTKNAGVGRALISAVTEVARKWTEVAVVGGAEEGPAGEQMRDILGRVGGVRMPLDFYMVPLGGK